MSIGVGVVVVALGDDGVLRFLVGRRSETSKRGPGVWALPGGMLEDGETIAQCVHREVREETGLTVEVEAEDEFMDCAIGVSHHYPRENHLTVWAMAYCTGGEPQVMEPTKCQEWRWVTLQEFLDLTPQVGEQVHWAPHRVLKIILPRIGFPLY